MLATDFGQAKIIAATGDVVATKDCYLLGFYVNTSSSGTLILKAGGSGGTALNGITGTLTLGWHAFPAVCPGGLHATVGGTLNATFFTTF